MTVAIRIDGKAMAANLSATIAAETAALLREHDLKPGLAAVIVGADPASQIYVRNKKRAAIACGFHSVQHTLASDSSEKDVLSLIEELNADEAIHGILVQLPLPAHLDAQRITQSISPAKDVDAFHHINIGKLTAGDTDGAFVPCTPAGCMFMIEEQLGSDLSGLSAVVVGRSNIVGKPVASLLLAANATVTMTHSRTRDLADVVRRADIVIDVGINSVEATVDGDTEPSLIGDVDFDEVIKVAAAISPVPGGVGPMTIAMLMANTLRSAKLSAGLEV